MKKNLGIFALAVLLLSSGAALAKEPVFECTNNSDKSDEAYAKCYLEDAKRQLGGIKEKYDKLAANPLLQKWNNGNGMFKGNLKDLFESWVAYRNRYCSLYGVAFEHYNGESAAFHQADCIRDMTLKHNAQMEAIVGSVTSQMVNDGGDLSDIK